MSQSMDKQANFSSSFSKVDPAVQNKSFVSKDSESIVIEAPKMEQKKKKKKMEEPIEEVIQEFDFMDEPKKKKKKSKSKQKKAKKAKDVKEVKKKESNTVEEDFDFL